MLSKGLARTDTLIGIFIICKYCLYETIEMAFAMFVTNAVTFVLSLFDL